MSFTLKIKQITKYFSKFTSGKTLYLPHAKFGDIIFWQLTVGTNKNILFEITQLSSLDYASLGSGMRQAQIDNLQEIN